MTDEPKWIEGATYVKLEVKRGRIIASTESGQTMIVPTTAPKAGDRT